AVKAKYGRDNTWVVGNHRLFVLQSMPIDCKAGYKTPPHPYLASRPVEEPVHIYPNMGKWSGYQDYGDDWTTAREKALDRTKGHCALCGSTDAVEVHHLKAVDKNGKNDQSNLVPLCRTCHRHAEQSPRKVMQILREATPDSGEPCALKGARTVRGEM